ncbi:MAG: response regulator [Cytophagaceae bacterium]|nr:response regulator [Cytophagaceae bacterium]|tara:strand:- start:2570 stop:3235 length:666 start_codon:yes stop_codon:yes gene_type:complete
MFNKVLIAEDLGWNTTTMRQYLEDRGASTVDLCQYCDDAYLKFLAANKNGEPYDLIIADLSFDQDHRDEKLKDGEELIEAIRQHDGNVPVIVFSMEERLQRVHKLFENNNINAYVHKSRKSMEDLITALQHISKGEIFLSSQIDAALDKRKSMDIDDYDINLLKLVSQGHSNREISDYLSGENITPSSVSSIEKRLNKLRIQFKAKNATHLVAVAKDMGLI